MQSITDFDFVPLTFDADGTLEDKTQLNTLEDHGRNATDAIFLAHGFRNDENDATALYSGFLNTFKQNMARPEFRSSLAGRKFVVAGVYWPSKAFRESFSTGEGSVESLDPEAAEIAKAFAQLEELKGEVDAGTAETLSEAQLLLPKLASDPDVQDAFVAAVLAALAKTELDATEGVERVLSQSGSDMLRKLRMPLLPAVATPVGDADGGGGVAAFAVVGGGRQGEGDVQSIGSIFGSIYGAVGKFLNMTTWYIMKNRAGVVGANGMAQAVRDLKARQPKLRIHLVGHSLGGRLMAACAKSLAQDPAMTADSLTLMEAAFSHYGFSANNGEGVPGFFRDVIEKHVVRGPMLSTFSFQDEVVGMVYAVASRLADDNVKAIGDASDPFGGIGRNGCQKTPESCVMALKQVSTSDSPYQFQSGKVNCLDGSGGLIKSHGDVVNENVTYAFATAVAAT